jgi:hypothetical protein
MNSRISPRPADRVRPERPTRANGWKVTRAWLREQTIRIERETTQRLDAYVEDLMFDLSIERDMLHRRLGEIAKIETDVLLA